MVTITTFLTVIKTKICVLHGIVKELRYGPVRILYESGFQYTESEGEWRS